MIIVSSRRVPSTTTLTMMARTIIRKCSSFLPGGPLHAVNVLSQTDDYSNGNGSATYTAPDGNVYKK